jgi:outer membrane protein TolC
MKRRLLLCGCAALLAGCRIPVQPPPQATLVVPPAWRGQVGPGAPVERDWWHAFADPALDRLVAQALERNNDVRTAQARLQEYRARVQVARAAGEPTLSVGFTPTRARVIGPFGTPIESTSLQGAFQAAYELDPFGRTASLTEASRLDYAAQQAAADATALSVAANTASGYLNLRGLDAQLDLARATLAGPGAAPVRSRLQLAPGIVAGGGGIPRDGRRRAAAGTGDRAAGKRPRHSHRRESRPGRAGHGTRPPERARDPARPAV